MAHIGIDINEARELHKDKMREVRKPLLEKEDVAFMKAVESDDAEAKAASISRKQSLRDCTNCVDDHEITSTDCIGVTNQLKQCWDTDVLGVNPLLESQE